MTVSALRVTVCDRVEVVVEMESDVTTFVMKSVETEVAVVVVVTRSVVVKVLESVEVAVAGWEISVCRSKYDYQLQAH